PISGASIFARSIALIILSTSARHATANGNIEEITTIWDANQMRGILRRSAADVRFPPKSGHSSSTVANSGHRPLPGWIAKLQIL
ncbi:MAG: hypothetical protein WBD15_22180, partial [Pseudolabrys sp.]